MSVILFSSIFCSHSLPFSSTQKTGKQHGPQSQQEPRPPQEGRRQAQASQARSAFSSILSAENPTEQRASEHRAVRRGRHGARLPPPAGLYALISDECRLVLSQAQFAELWNFFFPAPTAQPEPQPQPRQGPRSRQAPRQVRSKRRPRWALRALSSPDSRPPVAFPHPRPAGATTGAAATPAAPRAGGPGALRATGAAAARARRAAAATTGAPLPHARL